MFRKLLLGALLFAPSLAHANWYEASSKHFVVYADDSEANVRKFTEQLERFDQALRKITGMPDKPLSPSSRVVVYVVSLSDVQKLAKSSNVAGFYIPRAAGPVSFVPSRTSGPLDSQTILQHEYGHSFMFSVWPDTVFPPWFVEGFAEYVGSAFFRSDGSLILGKNPEHRSYGVSKSNYLPAERLVQLDPGKLDMYQTETLYARGWLLTHYLLSDPERGAQLSKYITALDAGKSVDEATKAFGNIGQLDTKLTAYAQRGTLATKRLAVSDLPIAPVKIRPLSIGEAAVMQARYRTETGVDRKDSGEVAALARRLAAPYPNDAAAQTELAEAELDAKNYAAAEAAADRALAADPKSVQALLMKGRAKMELAKKDEAASVATWKEIRALFIAANKLDTEYPEPLVQFYESFAAAKQPAPKGAQDALLYAYVLAPYDMELRMKAGQLLIRQNHLKEARVAFELVAYSPHSDKEKEGKVSRDVLTKLDASDSEGALKILADAAEKKKKDEEDPKKKGS